MPSPLPAMVLACSTGPEGAGAPLEVETDQDLVTTRVALDLESLEGHATLTARPSSEQRLRLDVGGLDLSWVEVDGEAREPDVSEGWLSLEAPGDEVVVDIDYDFAARSPMTFDGWMPALGVTFIWPYYCSNLFPCDPSMDDGLVYELDVTGVAEGLVAIFPEHTGSDGPAYMAGVAVGDYAWLELGETPSGTTIRTAHFDNAASAAAAVMGTAHLAAAFDFFETTYGPYAFGPEYGSVEVNWGGDSWGGMEHHPYSHIGTFDMDDEEVHGHEAGHGWFGDGVRLACWEDFVLSEGTTTYITARAMEQVGGPDLWPYYVDDFLEPICRGRDVNTVVLPTTCNEIDFVNDDLWSLATYMKGACFYGEVGDLIGAAKLDSVIGEFYEDHVNGTARMEEMLQAIAEATPASDLETLQRLEQEWLRTEACPTDYASRCRSRAAR